MYSAERWVEGGVSADVLVAHEVPESEIAYMLADEAAHMLDADHIQSHVVRGRCGTAFFVVDLWSEGSRIRKIQRCPECYRSREEQLGA